MSFHFRAWVTAITLKARVMILALAGIVAMAIVAVATHILSASGLPPQTVFIRWFVVVILASASFIGTLVIVLIE